MGISDGILKRITKWNQEQKKKNARVQLKKNKKQKKNPKKNLPNKKCKPDAVRDDW